MLLTSSISRTLKTLEIDHLRLCGPRVRYFRDLREAPVNFALELLERFARGFGEREMHGVGEGRVQRSVDLCNMI